MATRPKRLYFVKRHPSLSRDAFVPRWREHGRLAMHFMARQRWENVVRYAQCDAIHDHGLGGVDARYDGVGMIGFVDVEARKRHVSFAEARATLEADEDLAFGERVNKAGFVAAEHVVMDGPTTGVGVIRVMPRAHERGSDAGSHWQRVQREAVFGALAPALRRYVQDVPLPPENGVAWGLDCLGVEELWFDDIAAVRRLWPEIVASAYNRASAPTLIVREALLHPVPT